MSEFGNFEFWSLPFSGEVPALDPTRCCFWAVAVVFFLSKVLMFCSLSGIQCLLWSRGSLGSPVFAYPRPESAVPAGDRPRGCPLLMAEKARRRLFVGICVLSRHERADVWLWIAYPFFLGSVLDYKLSVSTVPICLRIDRNLCPCRCLICVVDWFYRSNSVCRLSSAIWAFVFMREIRFTYFDVICLSCLSRVAHEFSYLCILGGFLCMCRWANWDDMIAIDLFKKNSTQFTKPKQKWYYDTWNPVHESVYMKGNVWCESGPFISFHFHFHGTGFIYCPNPQSKILLTDAYMNWSPSCLCLGRLDS